MTERILSVVNGYRDCIFVPDLQTARINGCVFAQSSCTGSCALHTGPPTCNGQPQEVSNVQVINGDDAQAQLAAAQLARQCPTLVTPADGVVVTFSSPVLTSTLDASDFAFTLSDGTTVSPECAVLSPANEPNELETVLTLGNTNTGGAHPVGLTITGSLMLSPPGGGTVEAQGMTFTGDMRYETSKSTLVRARLEALIADPVAAGEEQGYVARAPHRFPNHCKHLFPSATHRVQLLFSGGITLDGVHAFWPSMPNPPVVALDGALQPLPAASVLGLADLGTIDPAAGCTEVYHDDGDNYLDICLKLDGDGPSPAHVRVLCTAGGVPVSPPKGAAYACDETYTVPIVGMGSSPPPSPPPPSPPLPSPPAAGNDNTGLIAGIAGGVGGAALLLGLSLLLFKKNKGSGVGLPKAVAKESATSTSSQAA